MNVNRKTVATDLGSHRLAELVETANATLHRDAMKDDLNSDLRAEMLIVGSLVER